MLSEMDRETPGLSKKERFLQIILLVSDLNLLAAVLENNEPRLMF